MSRLRVPVACRKEDGKHVLPCEAKKGVEYECIECSGRLIFNSGQLKQPYFSHYHATEKRPCEDALTNGESITHNVAKLTLRDFLQKGGLLVIHMTCHIQACNQTIRDPISIKVSTLDSLVKAEWRVKVDAYIYRQPDVVILENGVEKIAIEVFHTHRVTEQKRALLEGRMLQVEEVTAADILSCDRNHQVWHLQSVHNEYCTMCRYKLQNLQAEQLKIQCQRAQDEKFREEQIRERILYYESKRKQQEQEEENKRKKREEEEEKSEMRMQLRGRELKREENERELHQLEDTRLRELKELKQQETEARRQRQLLKEREEQALLDNEIKCEINSIRQKLILANEILDCGETQGLKKEELDRAKECLKDSQIQKTSLFSMLRSHYRNIIPIIDYIDALHNLEPLQKEGTRKRIREESRYFMSRLSLSS